VKTSSSARRATSSLAPAIALAIVGSFGCGGAKAPAASGGTPPGLSTAAVRPPVDFSFESLDERPVNADAMRGQPAIVAFITTSSLSSQAEVDFLVAMAKRDGNRVHYALVALERDENRELVELYRKALSVPFPVALADAQTLAGGGPFGDVSAVPVVVLLDRSGRLAWRIDGRVAKSEEIRAAMRGL
jgi:cytochrome oxidase Cu insertion factor (SCO1/SenC/PrrC family)